MNASSSTFVHALERRCMLSGNPGIDGIAVLGDSYSDEYQFYAPDRATARNWVEQLDEDSNVDFGAFSTIDPLGPQNAGFANNWAVSGATSSDMIAGGQHTGAAAQAASGAVDLVTMFIGGNDFRRVFQILATEGPGPALDALQQSIPTLLTNIAIASGTILSPPVLSANPDVHLILTTIPNPSYLPEVRAALIATPQIRPFVDVVDQAVEFVNGQVRNQAAANGALVAVVEFDGMIDRIFASSELRVGNAVIDLVSINNPTNSPSVFALADRIHPGTIGQGLLANLYVEMANRAFDADLQRLSTRDLLQNAGLAPGFATDRAGGGPRFADRPAFVSRAIDELFGTASDELPPT